MKPEISIVLGSFNRRPFLKKTIVSIRRNGIAVPFEIIVVDGGSTDGTLRWLTKQKDVISIVQHNRGVWKGKPVERRSWGYFMNLGFKSAQGKYICMLSDDCLVVPGSIQNAYEEFERLLDEGRSVGAMAFYWRNWPAMDYYYVGATLGGKIYVNHGMYLREVLEKVGWIEEEQYQFYFADGDLCLKIWQSGYEITDCKRAFVEHYYHANVPLRSTNRDRLNKDLDTYRRKWLRVPEIAQGGEKESDRIKLEYMDPYRTARGFLWLHLLNLGRYFDYIRVHTKSFIFTIGKKIVYSIIKK